MTRLELFKGYKGLMERLHSWDYFLACMKEVLARIKRPPNVPRKSAPDPARAEMFKRGVETLDEKARAVVMEVLSEVNSKAPFMLEKMVATLFRFGGSVAALPSVLEALDRRVVIESAPGYKHEIAKTATRIPPNFREIMQWEAFPRTYEWLRDGLTDKGLVAEGLVQVWKSFVIRWGETDFTAFEDYHMEHLRELCNRSIELGNAGDLGRSQVNAQVDGITSVQLRRLAGEVLVSVEQDLRGAPPAASAVPLTLVGVSGMERKSA
jgi:hypothetical protein